MYSSSIVMCLEKSEIKNILDAFYYELFMAIF